MSTEAEGRVLTVDADDLDAVINLVERSMQMLRERWNDMPVNETDAFVRLRAVADGVTAPARVPTAGA